MYYVVEIINIYQFISELQNVGMDCWYHCNSQQGPCSWCGSKGMCCTRKPGYTYMSNGCDGTIGGLTRHECSMRGKTHQMYK